MKVFATLALTGALALGMVGCQKHKHDHDEHDAGANITMNEVPQKVRDGFRTAYPKATVKDIEKEVYPDGTVHYEFSFTGADGKEKEVEFDKDGKELAPH
jgi:hypothetical protein